MAVNTIFTRYLKELKVPHTAYYSDSMFHGMTFKSLYGLSHLLKTYGIDNEGMRLSDKDELTMMPVPFLAQTKDGIFVIVKEIAPSNGSVTYDSLGETETIDLESFKKGWNGIALVAFPDESSREPDYASHHLTEIVSRMSGYLLALSAIVVFIYFFITRHVYSHLSTVLITLLDGGGLYLSYLLLQKSLNIHTAASDRVCGVLEKGGCDTVMSLKVSKLFGVFSWSEVGFGYFSVSMATLLLFPHLWGSLALCNLCCLPYTFWSIWYQKFRARHWCTLCVGVQSTLWLLFFCYLAGGWFHAAFPIHPDICILVAVYVLTVLFLNMILRIFKNLPTHEKNNHA